MSGDRFLEPYRDIARLRERALRVLGLEPDADLAAAREAFRRLAREHHPDVGGNSQHFVRIVNSYLILTRADPRGFLLEGEDDGRLDVPESAADYRRWWLSRFAP
jgi:curved DNA-binding protein CbpA